MEDITILDINKRLCILIEKLKKFFDDIDYKIDFGNCHCNKKDHKNKMLVYIGPFPAGTNKSGTVNDIITEELNSPFFEIVHRIWSEKYVVLTIDEKYRIKTL